MNDEHMLEELEGEERRLLLGARRALSPTDADAQRVLAVTLGTLAVASAAAATGSSAPAAEPLARAAQDAVAQVAAGWGVVPKLLAALALAGASGALGYGLGFRAGHDASTPRIERPARTAVAADRIATTVSGSDPDSVSGSGSDSVSGSGSGSDSVSGSDSGSGSDSVSVSDSVSGSDSVSDSVSGSAAVARGLARKSGAGARQAAEPEIPPTEPDPNALALELRALRQVERALREQQPRRALQLLGELDRDVPEGRLVEERLATFLMARCVLGLGTPARLRAEFIDDYPRSVYRARVEQSCQDSGREEREE